MSKMYKALARAKKERQNSLGNHFGEDPGELMLLDDQGRDELKWIDPMAMDQETGQVEENHHRTPIVKLDPEAMVQNRCVAMFPNREEAEAYKVLRTKIINRTWVTGGNLIMITSALPGEGKTVTAFNLAFTFAREFKEDALLVDCDFVNQSIHKLLGFRYEKGLVDYLLGDCPAHDLFVSSGIEKLSLISGGKTVQEGTQLIDSLRMKRMKDFVENMKGRYPEGYIFLDAPPVLSSIEALNLIPLVDHVLIVVQAGRTSTAQVSKAAQLIPKQKLLGLILNRFRV